MTRANSFRIAVRRPARPSRRLSIQSLEDRTVPANATNLGNALLIDLDHSGEALTVQTLNNTDIEFDLAGGTFTGDFSGTTDVIGPFVAGTSLIITDSAGNTSVTFADSGANTISAAVSVTLDDPTAAGITFDGATTFVASDQSFSTSGLLTVSSGATVSAPNNNVTFAADNIDLSGTLNVGSQTATLEPFSAGTQINLGGADAPGTLGLSSSEINNVTAGTLVIGRNDIATGAVSTSDIISPANAPNLTVITAQGITVTNNLSASGNLSLSANQQATPASGNFVGINVAGATITSATGPILLQGRGGDTGSLNAGILLQAGAVVSSTGTGAATITLNGTGGTGGSDLNDGVLVFGSGSRVTSVAGAVAITGTGGAGSADRNFGVWIDGGGQVTSTGTTGTAAPITITGTGGGGTNQIDGVVVEGAGSLVTSVAGAIDITGSAGTGSGSLSVGVAVINGGQVSSTGTGAGAATVTLRGTGGAGTDHDEGVVVNGGNAQVTSADGAIQVTGTAGSGSPSFAVDFSNTGRVTSTGTANVTLTGDSMLLDPTATINAGANTVTLQPQTVNTAINLGGADGPGTLGLTDGELSTVTAGVLRIGNATSGNITVTAPINSHPGYGTLDLLTGGSVSAAAVGDSLTVNTLAVQAASGIGSSGTPLPTQVSNLEANTGTGGIFITNGVTSPVTLTIGSNGFGPPDGVVVTGSGPVQFINHGTLNVTSTDDVIRSPDNVTVQAVGATADIRLGGQGASNAIRSTGTGDVSVTAGEDVLAGNAAGFGSIVAANGKVTVDAGRNVVVDADSRIANDNVGGTASGDVIVTAGGNITLQQTSTTGARINNSGTGQVTLTTGAGGTFTLNSGAGGNVSTNGGNITINADNVVINDPINAAINGGPGGIVTLDVVSTGRDVTLGTKPGGTLGLTNAELGQVTASILRVGDNQGRASNITVTAPVAAPAGWNTLSLLTNNGASGDITQIGGASLTVTNLKVFASGQVNLTDPGNTVSQLSGIASGSINFVDSTGLTIGNVDPGTGFPGLGSAFNGSLAVTALTGTLTVSNAIQMAQIGGTPGSVTLTADNMAINAAVHAPGNFVQLEPTTAGRPIDLGHNPSLLPGQLGLAQTDLNNITAGVLRVGSGTAGAIAFTAPITAPAGWNTLSLLTGSTVSEPGAGSVSVPNLAIQATSLIGLGGNNAVSNLAAVSTSSALVFRDSVPLTVTTVDGVGGISTGGLVLVESTAANTGLTVSQPVTTNGNQDIVLTFDNMTLGAGVSAVGHRVTLEPFSVGQLVNVGGPDAPGTLGLDSTDLGQVTADTLQVGNSTTGDMTVSASVSPPNAGNLDLVTGGSFLSNASTTVTAAGNLSIQAANNVTVPVSSGLTAGGTITVAADTPDNDPGTGKTISLLGPLSGTSASVLGGPDSDSITVAPPATTPTTIDGGTGTDTVFGTAGNDTFTLTGTGAGNYGGTVSFINVESLDGNGGTDTLVGQNVPSAWQVTGANSGTVTGLTSFTGFANLTGGTGADGFTFGTGGSLTGSIDGGAGSDTITGDNTGRTFTISGGNGGTIGTLLGGSFANVENLTGGSGADGFTFVTPGSLAGGIDGGGGSDTITGDNTGRTFTVNAVNGGTIGTLLGGTFANVENLTGGTGNDQFTIAAGGSLAGGINGGAGTDGLDNTAIPGSNVTLTGPGSADGFQGTATGLGGTFDNVNAFTTNSIGGPNTPTDWIISGTNSGTLTSGAVTANWAAPSLVGGSSTDTFTFVTPGSLSGTIDGGAGTNTITGDNTGDTFTVTGANAGTIAGILPAGFTNVENLTGGTGTDSFTFVTPGTLTGTINGGAGTDTITGDATGRTFTVTGSNAGTVGTILPAGFTNVENLTGGSAGDSFVFNGGTLGGSIDGGAGSDTITGDNTGRTFTISGANGGTIGTLLGGTFANVENLTGGTGNDTFQFTAPGALAGTVDGGAGNDLLIGDNNARTFTLTGANQGTVSTILPAGFANVESLQGGSAGDTLAPLPGGTLTGSFDGKGGTDTVDLSAILTAQTLTITGTGAVDGFNVNWAPVTGGLLDVNVLTATAAAGDTLNGANAASLWTVSNINAGTYQDVGTSRTLVFNGFENLAGGTANDNFVFANGGSLTGTVAGNTGTDTVKGDDGGRTFDVTGAGAGTVTAILPAGFTGVDNLIGGTGADTLTVEAAGTLAGSFDGLAGTDTANLSNLASQQITATGTGAVDGLDTTGGTSVAGGLLDINTVIGSLTGTTDDLTGLNADGTYTVATPDAGTYQDNTSSRTLTFANFENLTGGSANDTLIVQATGFLGGAFDGMGGYDTADLSAGPGQSAVVSGVGTTDGYNLTGISTVAGGLLDLQKVIGSAAATTDDLTGRNVAATWTVDGANAGHYVDTSTRTLDFVDFENLTGGTANDTLVMQAGGSLAGAFDGGLGTDTGDFSALGSQAFVVNNLGTADGYNVTNVPTVAGNLLNVNSLIGSTTGTTDSQTGMNVDSTFTLPAANAGTYQDNASAQTLAFSKVENLDGGTGNDTLVVKVGGSLAGAFDGGAGTDTADLSALSAVQQITVLALGATDGFNTTGGTTVTGGFLDVDKVYAGKAASAVLGSSDRLTGANADATWLVKAGTDQSYYQDNASGRKLIFANFEELYGGSGKDAVTVDFSAGNPLETTGLTVNGQSGSDSLSTIGQSAVHNGFRLGPKAFHVNGHAIRYKNFETLSATGGNASDNFYAPTVSLPSMVRLVNFFAGGGNDYATVSATTLAVLHLDGGSGTNTLHVLSTGQHYVAPIPPKSAVSGTYFFSNRARIDFINWGIRNIGITQPQP